MGFIDELEDAWCPPEPSADALLAVRAEARQWINEIEDEEYRQNLLGAIAVEEQSWNDLELILDELADHLALNRNLWQSGDGRGAVVLTMLRDRLLNLGVYEPLERNTVRNRRNLKSGARYRIMERDDFTCQHCGARRNLQVDHIHPVAHGGSNDDDNLQTLCAICNARKGARV